MQRSGGASELTEALTLKILHSLPLGELTPYAVYLRTPYSPHSTWYTAGAQQLLADKWQSKYKSREGAEGCIPSDWWEAWSSPLCKCHELTPLWTLPPFSLHCFVTNHWRHSLSEGSVGAQPRQRAPRLHGLLCSLRGTASPGHSTVPASQEHSITVTRTSPKGHTHSCQYHWGLQRALPAVGWEPRGQTFARRLSLFLVSTPHFRRGSATSPVLYIRQWSQRH